MLFEGEVGVIYGYNYGFSTSKGWVLVPFKLCTHVYIYTYIFIHFYIYILLYILYIHIYMYISIYTYF